MAGRFANDHRLRKYAIMRYMNEILEVRYFDDKIIKNLDCMRYREIIRPLVIQDKSNGTQFGMLKIRYGLSEHKLRKLLQNYYEDEISD